MMNEDDLSIRDIQCPKCKNDRLKVEIRTHTNIETGERRQWTTAICTDCDDIIVVHRKAEEVIDHEIYQRHYSGVSLKSGRDSGGSADK